ncbi:Oidioi.mRNA.OKI2018_I69.chr2.g4554.t1.cds [Oikopleura dioica]|uniref:Carbohydrate sulfotransferase n=1 Tax=Oikopleura dioica TaxID=34765 RepID=A0ABN7T205_OIKDI|nr:Oidioi.mRNA.OKI2018_I69.chr2.g4554.t1.cds [Oikopleura dioica]
MTIERLKSHEEYREEKFKELKVSLDSDDQEEACKTLDKIVSLDFPVRDELYLKMNFSQVEIPWSYVTPEEEMQSRLEVYNHACFGSCKSYIAKTIKKNEKLSVSQQREALQKLQSLIISGSNCESDWNSTYQNEILPDNDRIYQHTFLLDKYNGAGCVPLKTGTTNWQRSFGALRFLSDEKPTVDPEMINSEIAFKLVPRYAWKYENRVFGSPEIWERNNFPFHGIDLMKQKKSLRKIRLNDPLFQKFEEQREKSATRPTEEQKEIIDKCGEKAFQKRVEDKKYLRFINVRHPFSRLFSAWRQKFSVNFHNAQKFEPIAAIIREQQKAASGEEDIIPPGFVCSFKGFLRYVILKSKEDKETMNHHWVSYQDSCEPCFLKLNAITKQETSHQDSAYIFEKMSIRDKTYMPGMYDTHVPDATEKIFREHQVDKEIIEELYIVYYNDFILFNYTIDSFLEN